MAVKSKSDDEQVREIAELALGVSSMSAEEIKPIGELMPQVRQETAPAKPAKDLLGDILYGQRVNNHITLPVSIVTSLSDIVNAVRRNRFLGSRDRLSLSALVSLMLAIDLELLEKKLGPDLEKELAARIQGYMQQVPIGSGGSLEAALAVLRELLDRG